MLFELEYRRIEEGKIVIDAPSLDKAQRLLNIELDCGAAPVLRRQNICTKAVALAKEAANYAS